MKNSLKTLAIWLIIGIILVVAISTILENSNTNMSMFERKISEAYSSFGEFTSFAFWFSVAPAADTTMYILGEDV